MSTEIIVKQLHEMANLIGTYLDSELNKDLDSYPVLKISYKESEYGDRIRLICGVEAIDEKEDEK